MVKILVLKSYITQVAKIKLSVVGWRSCKVDHREDVGCFLKLQGW
jgi:hypothetical protein